MAHAAIRIISGNFITASPLGVIDGIDLQLTGKVRRIAHETIEPILNANAIVLLSPLGFSQTGEAFNLTMEDVAVFVAVSLHAEKLIFITEDPLMKDTAGEAIHELSSHQADAVLQAGFLPEGNAFNLKYALKASKGGVPRACIRFPSRWTVPCCWNCSRTTAWER